jgi:hypothetical protein
MVQWKKSGYSCPRCNQETEVLVGTMGDTMAFLLPKHVGGVDGLQDLIRRKESQRTWSGC